MPNLSKVGTDTDKGRAILELQAIKQAVVAGAAAATNIAVTGIKTTDKLVGVTMFAAGVPTDETADASITSAGNIQLATTVSTGNTLLVIYIPATF